MRFSFVLCSGLLIACGGATVRGTAIARTDKLVYIDFGTHSLDHVQIVRLRGPGGRIIELTRDQLALAANGRLALHIPVDVDSGGFEFGMDDGTTFTEDFDADDIDTDGDGTVDSEDNDTDGDGIPDDQDDDDDGDGVSDAQDQDGGDADDGDADHDGVADSQDNDDDNDGTPDAQDNDDDNDGIPDAQDNDDDNDGVPDSQENGGDDQSSSGGDDSQQEQS